MIPSENLVSEAVLEAMGSVLTNKYAEGYPGKRYYGGLQSSWTVPNSWRSIAPNDAFSADHANVQGRISGTQANISVYMTALQPGDTVLGMNLAHGGHLTHGHPLNFSGKTYKFVPYGVRKDNETIDYEEIERLAAEHKPKMIVAGASAYSRIIDFPRLAKIAEAAGAVLFVDMAHIAGLVAAGPPSLVPHADFVSTTTHNRCAARAAAWSCAAKRAKDLDRITFPGTQGGPLMHTIAAKAVCLKEAMQPEFREYQFQVVRNAKALAEGIARRGYRIVSGGTDNHLLLVDLYSRGLTGKEAQLSLDRAGITVNKNSIPFDPTPPMTGGGIRLGSPSVTTRGMREPEMDRIAGWIGEILGHLGDAATEQRIRGEVAELASAFPIYTERWQAADGRVKG